MIFLWGFRFLNLPVLSGWLICGIKGSTDDEIDHHIKSNSFKVFTNTPILIAVRVFRTLDKLGTGHWDHKSHQNNRTGNSLHSLEETVPQQRNTHHHLPVNDGDHLASEIIL
jgi:hypothetical protein